MVSKRSPAASCLVLLHLTQHESRQFFARRVDGRSGTPWIETGTPTSIGLQECVFGWSGSGRGASGVTSGMRMPATVHSVNAGRKRFSRSASVPLFAPHTGEWSCTLIGRGARHWHSPISEHPVRGLRSEAVFLSAWLRLGLSCSCLLMYVVTRSEEHPDLKGQLGGGLLVRTGRFDARSGPAVRQVSRA